MVEAERVANMSFEEIMAQRADDKNKAMAAGAAEEEEGGEGDEEADAVVCGHCGISESAEARTFSRCARCKLVPYCSEACQKVAWRSHKAVCQSQEEQAFLDPREELLREHARTDFKCPIWFVPTPLAHALHLVVLCCLPSTLNSRYRLLSSSPSPFFPFTCNPNSPCNPNPHAASRSCATP